MKKKKGPGRSGLKNLKRKDGLIINQFGVKITDEEARQLRNVVQKVNRKAAKMEKSFEGMPLFFGSHRLDENRQQLKLMGEQMDIMIRKRSAGLQSFQTRAQFENYLRNTKRAAETDYIDYRGKLYKRNLIKAINEQFAQFPEMVKGVTMKIQMMPQAQFQKMVGSNRAMQISYMYTPDQQITRLMALRDSLGMNNSKFDDYDY